MIFVGIDPGKNGGISYVAQDSYCTIPMPTTFDLHAILLMWQEAYGITHCFLEKSQAMPGQGVTSMFNYGNHFGQIQGLLMAHKISHTLVNPKEWQKEMLKGSKKDEEKTTKDRALEIVRRLFPKESFLPTSRHKKPHDGMIDSILIAEYCRRKIIS